MDTLKDYAAPDANLGLDTTEIDVDRAANGRITLPEPREPLDRESYRVAVPTALVNECKAVELMRKELGRFTELLCIKRYGDWSTGGEPHITRRYVAVHNRFRAGGMTSSGECASAIEAVTALIQLVNAAVGSAPTLGKLDGVAMAAAGVEVDEYEMREMGEEARRDVP